MEDKIDCRSQKVGGWSWEHHSALRLIRSCDEATPGTLVVYQSLCAMSNEQRSGSDDFSAETSLEKLSRYSLLGRTSLIKEIDLLIKLKLINKIDQRDSGTGFRRASRYILLQPQALIVDKKTEVEEEESLSPSGEPRPDSLSPSGGLRTASTWRTTRDLITTIKTKENIELKDKVNLNSIVNNKEAQPSLKTYGGGFESSEEEQYDTEAAMINYYPIWDPRALGFRGTLPREREKEKQDWIDKFKQDPLPLPDFSVEDYRRGVYGAVRMWPLWQDLRGQELARKLLQKVPPVAS